MPGPEGSQLPDHSTPRMLVLSPPAEARLAWLMPRRGAGNLGNLQ